MNESITERLKTILLLLFAATVLAGVVFGGFHAVDGKQQSLSFEDATAEAQFSYTATDTGIGNGNDGVYVTDFDNDQWSDVLAIGGQRPVLFENHGGTFRRSGALPEIEGRVKSALFYDADGDGWEDLLLMRVDAAPVFLSNEGGEYQRESVGLQKQLAVPVGATVADFDGDSNLDLFIVQYGDWRRGAPEGYFDYDQKVTADNGNRNKLYLWNGSGYERAAQNDINGSRWSLATSAVDLNGDGRPDIHVANDFNNDVVYVNQGNGTFQQTILPMTTARNGMSSEVVDVNQDGQPDVLVTNIYLPVSHENLSQERFQALSNKFPFIFGDRIKGNVLLVNDGNGSFSDRAEEYGIQHGGWGWAPSFRDYDNDGDKDLVQTTQRFVRVNPDDPVYTYPMVWERQADSFERQEAAEAGFAETNGRGLATLDYDRDGRMDIVMATYNSSDPEESGRFKLYQNTAGDSNALTVALDAPAHLEIGAVVRAETSAGRSTTLLTDGSDYASQDSRVAHIGLSEASRVERLSVRWSNGETTVLTDIRANQRIVVSPEGLTNSTTYTEP